MGWNSDRHVPNKLSAVIPLIKKTTMENDSQRFYFTEYSCHGSWEDNGISYVIASPVARKSTDALRYCFIYTLSNQPETTVIEGSMGKKIEPPILRLSSVSESCHRHIIPGVTGNWAFNFTSNGENIIILRY